MATVNLTSTRRQTATASRPGSRLQVAGGIAALLQGLAVIGSVVLFQMVQPDMGLTDRTWDEPTKVVPFVVAHQGYFTFVGLFLIVSALTVPPVLLALYTRLRSLSPALIGMATFFGSIGATLLLLNATGQSAEFHAFRLLSTRVAEQAEPYGNIAYQATEGSAQVALGVSILLLSWAVTSRGGLPRWLGYLGLLVGITCPVAIFGPPIGALLSIPWFVGVGIALLRSATDAGESNSQTSG